MNILLISDLPPCADFSGPLLTSELCDYLDGNGLYAFIAKNQSLSYLNIDASIRLSGLVDTFKPSENTFNIRYGNNHIVNLLYETFHEFYTVRKLYRKIKNFILSNKIDKVWIILQGQTMINLAKLLVSDGVVPVYTQVWDEPKWWLIANKVNSLSSKRILANFDYAISHSAGCGVASDNMAEYYTKKYNVKCEVLIPTLKNIEIPKYLVQSSNTSNEIYIGMCGQIYAYEEWSSFIQALDSINWTIFGKKIKIAYVGYSLSDNTHKNIINHGYKSQVETINILADCDIQYCPYIIADAYEEVSKYSFPSKIVTYLATSKPIFYHGPLYSSPAKLVSGNKLGVICHTLGIEDILSALNEVLSSEESYMQMKRNVYKTYNERFTSTQLKCNFLSLLGMSKVSIIIPVYDGANYLASAIESALAQTYQNIEVIVVNDGSNDSNQTEDIALSFGNRVRYFYKKNGGVASALNLGIEKMTGSYFSWLSHDDLYLPNKISTQLDLIKNVPDNIILYSDFEFIDDTGTHISNHCMDSDYLNQKPLYSILRCAIHGCSLLIPKSAFEDCGVFNEKLKTTQDYDLWFRMRYKYTFRHMSSILIKSRQHDNQDSKKSPVLVAEGNSLWIGFIGNLTADEILQCEANENIFFNELAKFLDNSPFLEAADFCRGKLNQ